MYASLTQYRIPVCVFVCFITQPSNLIKFLSGQILWYLESISNIVPRLDSPLLQGIVEPKSGRNMERTSSFFASNRQSERKNKDNVEKGKDGSSFPSLPSGKQKASIGPRASMGLPISNANSNGSGKLTPPPNLPPIVSQPPPKAPDQASKGDTLLKQGPPTASPGDQLLAAKMQPPPQTPSSSDADSLNNSNPSSSSHTHQHGAMGPRPGGPINASSDFRAITINAREAPQNPNPLDLPLPVPPRLQFHSQAPALPTQPQPPSSNPQQQSHSKPATPSGGGLLAGKAGCYQANAFMLLLCPGL